MVTAILMDSLAMFKDSNNYIDNCTVPQELYKKLNKLGCKNLIYDSGFNKSH